MMMPDRKNEDFLTVGSEWWHWPDFIHNRRGTDLIVYSIRTITDSTITVNTPGGTHRESPENFFKLFIPVIKHEPVLFKAQAYLHQIKFFGMEPELKELLIELDI